MKDLIKRIKETNLVKKTTYGIAGLTLLSSCGDDLDLQTRGKIQVGDYFYEFFEQDRGRTNYLIQTKIDSTYQITFVDKNNNRLIDGWDDGASIWENNYFRIVTYGHPEFSAINEAYMKAQEVIQQYFVKKEEEKINSDKKK